MQRAPDPEVRLDLHPRPFLGQPLRVDRAVQVGALPAVVAVRRAEPKQRVRDQAPAAAAAAGTQPPDGRVRVDGVPDADADDRRAEVANLALAAAQEGNELRRERRIVKSQPQHRRIPPLVAVARSLIAAGWDLQRREGQE